MWEKSEGQIRPISKNEDYPQDWISTKTTKYTTKYDAKGMPIDTKDKTWTAAGIERFNTLFLEVKKNRRQFPHFLACFIAWKQSSSKKGSASVTSSKDNLPDVNDDLFYDPDDLNMESFTPDSKKESGTGQQDDSSDEDSDSSEENFGSDSEENESAKEDEKKKKKKEKGKEAKRKLKMV